MCEVLLDGPMGTELERRGLRLAAPDWSARALDAVPELVAAIHRDYASAGATLHTATTFRTQRRAVGPRWEELARRAVRIARRAGFGRVAGSIAPLEDCYRPDLSPGTAARAEHSELARVLSDEGVDVILCETFASPIEAAVAVEAAAATGVETWVSLTAGPDANLLTPEAMQAAARACVSAGARAVLVGCTRAARTAPFVDAIAEVGPTVGAYANAGDPSDGTGWSTEPVAAAARYAELAADWMDRGATIVGGCCGTRPEHVARLRELLSSRGGRRSDRS
ncbi:MAG: homocysteine S-methyltransferase family protein [Polyangiaceae bacterium]|nr:homocysteine S-methyltransferase family protein [Polyangiaceae bacterium]